MIICHKCKSKDISHEFELAMIVYECESCGYIRKEDWCDEDGG